MWCHRGTHPPFTSVVLRSWAFCFKGSTLWMLSFLYTCKCDSLPSDVPFFIWENIWCVLRDGHTRPRNYRHVQTSAIFLQTKPAGRIFAIPLRQLKSVLEVVPECCLCQRLELAPGQSPQPSPVLGGKGDVPGLLCSVSARHSSLGLTAWLHCWRDSRLLHSLL